MITQLTSRLLKALQRPKSNLGLSWGFWWYQTNQPLANSISVLFIRRFISPGNGPLRTSSSTLPWRSRRSKSLQMASWHLGRSKFLQPSASFAKLLQTKKDTKMLGHENQMNEILVEDAFSCFKSQPVRWPPFLPPKESNKQQINGQCLHGAHCGHSRLIEIFDLLLVGLLLLRHRSCPSSSARRSERLLAAPAVSPEQTPAAGNWFSYLAPVARLILMNCNLP